jgi:hypothetical protein
MRSALRSTATVRLHRDLYAAAYAVAVGPFAFESHRQPVVALVGRISKNCGRLTDVRDHAIDVPVIVQVSKGGSPACFEMLNAAPPLPAERGEITVVIVKQHRGLLVCRLGAVSPIVSRTWPCVTKISFQPSLS